MVKEFAKNCSKNINEKPLINGLNCFNENKSLIHVPEELIKNNKPFIPKALLKIKAETYNQFLENDIKKQDDNSNMKSINININNTERKNSTEVENTSTSDEASPSKNKNKNKTKNKEKKAFLKKKNKKKKAKKDPKEPFKGEAIDFKIKFKTELCKYYEANQYCPYGDKCAYAHGKENLRSKVTNTTAYRSKKCTQFFEQGYCPYGNRCQFAHQLKTNIINNPYDKSMSYSKILEIISKLENAENVKKLVEKPRLPVFESIYKCEKKKESRLLNDIKKLKNSGIF